MRTSQEVTVVDESADLDGLAPAWDRLATNPLEHAIWVRAWAATFGADYRPHVFVVGPIERPAAIAPLVRRRGRARLELLGVRDLDEPAALVVGDPSALPSVVDAIARARLPLLLRRVLDPDVVVGALRGASRRRALIVSSATAGAPWIALGAEWPELESRFDPKHRSDLRRARRRAEEAGEITAHVLAPTRAEVDTLLDECFRIEAAGWKGERRTALVADIRLGAFFRRYALEAAERGVLRLCFLRIGGRTAAMQIAVESDHRFWLLKIGYDPEFARSSPGQLLMLETLRWAAERGLEAYELLGRAEPWTVRWTHTEHACAAVRSYPVGIRGGLALAADLPRALRLATGR